MAASTKDAAPAQTAETVAGTPPRTAVFAAPSKATQQSRAVPAQI
ncbi:hypothetical protein [Streptomyces mexicanus]|nr:hypothetical protein [Streptomyces mexicanus]